MFKMTNMSEYHGNARFIGFSNGFFITNRSARLDNGCNAVFCCRRYGIAEWEECIRCEDCALHFIACFFVGQF